MSDSNPNPTPEENEDEFIEAVEEQSFADEEAPEASPEAQQAAGAYGGADKIAELEGQVATARDQAMRALAEAENTRKRAQKDREDASKYGISGFARDLLSVADNLRRALDSMPKDNEELSGIVAGIEATERELLRAFEKNGVKAIDPEGEIFSPNYHEVMVEIPGTGQPGGTIIQVMEKGYILHDRLLRPARVGVAKDEGGEPPPQAGSVNLDA